MGCMHVYRSCCVCQYVVVLSIISRVPEWVFVHASKHMDLFFFHCFVKGRKLKIGRFTFR